MWCTFCKRCLLTPVRCHPQGLTAAQNLIVEILPTGTMLKMAVNYGSAALIVFAWVAGHLAMPLWARFVQHQSRKQAAFKSAAAAKTASSAAKSARQAQRKVRLEAEKSKAAMAPSVAVRGGGKRKASVRRQKPLRRGSCL